MPTAPWTLYLGAGWAVDTWDRPPVERLRTVERVIGPKVQGQLRGLVHRKPAPGPAAPAESGTQDGIADAIVVFDDHPELTSRATGKDGRFVAPVTPGRTSWWSAPRGTATGLAAARCPPLRPMSSSTVRSSPRS